MSTLSSTTRSPPQVNHQFHRLSQHEFLANQPSTPPTERAAAEAGFIQLVEALTAVGLAIEVRHGDQDSLLVLVKIASADLLAQQVYRARLQDWLHGVRASAPDKDVALALQSEPATEAERLRLIYLLMIKPKNEGGAGISPSNAKWKHIHAIFPLHNHAFNKAWIKKWSSKYLLDQEDLDSIRDKFGENVAFYFAFLGSYFRFLVVPSSLGLGAWLLLGQFSTLYALLCGLWSVVFFEYWKKKEVDLAVQWGVRGVSNIQQSRPEFEWEHEAEDAVTGEVVKVYPPLKRVKTQLLQIPFTVACVIALGSLIVTCNSLEVFINEVYNGPGKQYLVSELNPQAMLEMHQLTEPGVFANNFSGHWNTYHFDPSHESRREADRHGELCHR